MPKPVRLETADGVTLAGLYCRGSGRGPAALLLHMMPATKESWQALTPQLLRFGWTILAIDLRGHGQSVNGPGRTRLDYKLFEDADHQAKIHDVEAAMKWLADRAGVPASRMALVGASIGANLAIAYAAAHPEVPAVAALSPGLDYRGVTTPDKVGRFRPEQALLLAASAEDELSFATIGELAKLKPDAVVKKFHGAGHGTGILESQPKFLVELAGWLNERVK